MADKEARELTEGTAKILRNVSIAFAAVMTIVAMYFMVRYAYPSALDGDASKISVAANFIKLLRYWGWKLTPIGILNFLIGVVHVLVFIVLVLGGLAIDIVTMVIPLTIGLFIGLLFLLITWGSGNAFVFGLAMPIFLAHIAVIFGISLLVLRLMFRIFAFIFGFSAKPLEYSVGFLGYRFYRDRLLKGRRAAESKVEKPSLAKEVKGDMSDDIKESLEKEESESLKKLAEYQVLYPEISNEEGVAQGIQNLLESPVLRNSYDGYIAEATKRFAMRQLQKTMDSQLEILKKVRAIIDELIAIQKARNALSEAVYEREMSRIRNEIRVAQLRSGQLEERIRKEEEIKDKLLELEEARLEAEIEEAKAKKEKASAEAELAKKKIQPAEKGPSASERLIQSTKDKIEMMRAKSYSLDLIREAMKIDLAGETDEKMRKEKERLWLSFLMERREE